MAVSTGTWAVEVTSTQPSWVIRVEANSVQMVLGSGSEWSKADEIRGYHIDAFRLDLFYLSP